MSETGRVAAFFGVGKPFEILEFPVPDPGPGAMVLRVELSNICGSDMHVWRGDMDLEGLGVIMPIVLGHEMVGRVHRLGEGVVVDAAGEPLEEGDAVVHRWVYPCGKCRACLRRQTRACPFNLAGIAGSCHQYPHFTGSMADYYYVHPTATVFKVPEGIEPHLAAGVNCALSQVIEGFTQARLTMGETVVIQGAGGLGIYATAVAKEMGAEKVIVIDGVPERLELARAFGADHTIDLKELTTPDERADAVLDLTDSWGADVVVELVGLPEVVPEGLAMLGSGGRYLDIGNINFGRTYQADPAQLVMTNKSIIGVFAYESETLHRALSFLARTRDRFPFERVFSHEYPLEQINEAFAASEVFGKGASGATRTSVSMAAGGS